ncbi:nuclear transport factor 2 family protein [Cupriavidus taiwanensis]|uniref:nuclear transport factor 2 family protein n=1 Tax=Cupriavidus taiwanensis TaxID=164546 RepID=UPI000E134F43|nr:nuclear transport factor 2 family protein [Cupriavidus taiwanensis]SOZ29607.1 conserved hypothetical protein [Cupriavidus taiwanensis]SPA34442.1 conserved hypothetical protein [Cupriavidus taiwanensis]
MTNTEKAFAELFAREAIREVLYRYCRAVDRADEASIRDCYWPDATDQHGIVEGPIENFLGWASKVLKTTESSVHQIHNILFEFREDGCAVESYFSAFDCRPDHDGVMRFNSLKGRYVDWFVQREGVWKVKDRIVVFDWVEDLPLPKGSRAERFGHRRPMGERWPDDPVYKVGR